MQKITVPYSTIQYPSSQIENSEVSTHQVHLKEAVLHGPKGGESTRPCIGYLSLDSWAHRSSQMQFQMHLDLDARRSLGDGE